MPPDADTRSSADQQYLDSLTARQLMDFRDYIRYRGHFGPLLTARNQLFSPTYISLNAGKFLDDKWVNVGLFREYVQRISKSSMCDVSSTRPSVPNSAPIKIESLPPVLPSSVKAEPETLSLHWSGDVKMRALTEDGHEVFELLSDSDAEEDLNSDLEVIEALRRTSRSSSVIAPSIPDSTVDDNLDGDIGGGPSHDDQDFTEFPEGDRSAEDDFPPVNNFPLVESHTIWQDGGKSFGTSHRHQYFVGCSGWTKKFKDNHQTHAIPDHVDEHLLIKALAGQPLTEDKTKDTPPCSAIIHPHIGLKRKTCTHPHIVNGVAVKGQIMAYPCSARRTIYVPENSSIRKALIIHNTDGHNHPMPMIIKVSFAHKDTYRQCIDAHGVLGATLKSRTAQSTYMLLNGKKPSEHAPALYNTRIKKDLLHDKKIEKYPNAIWPIFHADLDRVFNERYIHSYINTPKGETIIITFIPALLHLLDDPGVTSFDGDTTFKGIEGKINEWELTIFAKVVQRAASLLRAFINGASTDFFEILFDEIQRIKLSFTRKPFPFKTFVRGGNLLVTNVNMDAAQVIGLTRSVLKYSDPEYSGIPLDTPPEKVAPKFIKVCWRHAKEPIHDFRSLVSTSDFNRLKNCVYIEDKEALDDFTAFVYGLGIKKITDWWKHKEMHEWIIPCVVKSQSDIPADVWDATLSTTNTNEGQHHWTNSLTGIKLTPVEALERVDSDVAREIAMSLSTGILTNPNNEMSHRVAQNAQRQAAAAQKARESHDTADLAKDLRLQIEEAAARTKELKAQLKATKGTSGRGKSDASAILSASSSERVRTAPARAARTNATTTQSDMPTADQSYIPALDMPTAPLIPIPVLEPWMMGFNSFPPQFDFPAEIDFNMLMDVPNATDATLFGLNTDNCSTLLPFAGTPVPYPWDNYFDGFITGLDATVDATMNAFNFGSLASSDPWPVLPVPPPDSPLAMALPAASEPGAIVAKLCRCRQEVDEADILPENLKRARAPSTRKRGAQDEVISDPDQPQKKKGKRNTRNLQ
ncbi:hypothetical protein K438DRAFT_1954146 [Mycena galopus ATCC 62051]|nr:hypothetical protein K438DRAFT_1954146 [Mycena galopus ATCC 62051]